MNQKNIVCLVDMNGTLTKPRKPIAPDFYDFLMEKIKPLSKLALVGGSDIKKIAEQMHDDVIHRFDYVFAENGLVYFKNGDEIKRESIVEFMGEEKLQRFINYCLRYMSEITLPVKRGVFVDFRTGLINISPIGRSCTHKERDEFEVYDRQHKIREKMIEALKNQFSDFGLKYSIGGQISFDVVPEGWDKTVCLRHLETEGFDEIHFFGDKTEKGGNDYEIFIDKRVVGHKVVNPADTKQQLENIFGL